MSQVNSPIEGGFMVAGQVGGGAAAFSSGFNYVVGKSSPVRIVHGGDNATVYDDIVASERELNEGYFQPSESGIISVIGYQSKIWGGDKSRTSALGDDSEIELRYMNEPVTPDYPISDAIAFVAGSNSRISTDTIVQDSVLLAAGHRCLINDQGAGNTVICTGNESDINVGKNTLMIFTENKCDFSLGEGAVAVFCWHDGVRRQVTVVREGENGVTAGRGYLFENGNIS